MSIAVAQRSPVSDGRFRTWAKGADAATRAVDTGAVMVLMVVASGSSLAPTIDDPCGAHESTPTREKLLVECQEMPERSGA